VTLCLFLYGVSPFFLDGESVVWAIASLMVERPYHASIKLNSASYWLNACCGSYLLNLSLQQLQQLRQKVRELRSEQSCENKPVELS